MQRTVTENNFKSIYPLLDPHRIPAGGGSSAQNVSVDHGVLRTRPPLTPGSALVSSDPIRRLLEYVRQTATPSVRHLVAQDSNLFVTTTTDQSWTSPQQLVASVSTMNPVRFQQFLDMLYFVDGESPVKYWAGGTAIGQIYPATNNGGASPTIDVSAYYTGTNSAILFITITLGGTPGIVTYPTFSWVIASAPGGTGTVYASGTGTIPVEATPPATTPAALGLGVILDWPIATYDTGDTFQCELLPIQNVTTLLNIPTPSGIPALTTLPADTLFPTRNQAPSGIGARLVGGSSAITAQPRARALASEWFAVHTAGYGAAPNVTVSSTSTDPNGTGFTGSLAQASETQIDGALVNFVFSDWFPLLTPIDVVTRGLYAPAHRSDQNASSSLMLEIVGNGDSVSGNANYGAIMYGATEFPLDLSSLNQLSVDFSIYGAKQLGVNSTYSSGGTLQKSYSSHLFFEFGPDNNGGAEHLKYAVEIPLSGVDIDGGFFTGTIDLTSVAPAARQNITCMAFSFYSGLAGVNTRLEFVSSSVTAVNPGIASTIDGGSPNCVGIIIDRVYVGTNTIAPGTYEFCYCYNQFQGLSRVMSPPSQISTIDILTDAASGICLGIPVGSEVTLGTNDQILVFVRGTTSADFQQIACLPGVSGQARYSYVWLGGIAEGTLVLDPYVNAPPVNATCLSEHRGRMCYAVGPWFYLSNRNDPTKVPNVPLLDLYDNLGGKYQIGREGGSITALVAVKDKTLIFRGKGIHVFSGERARDFDFQLVDDHWGTQIQETVQVIKDTAFWLDTSGTVCAWREGEPITEVLGGHESEEKAREIGCPVATYIRSLTAYQRANAFAVSQLQTPQYWLIFPPANGTTALAGVAVVYDLRTATWTIYENIPALCGMRAPYSNTPGIYLADVQTSTVTFAGEWYDMDTSAAWSWVSGALQPPVLALEPIPPSSIVERDKIIEQVTVLLKNMTGPGLSPQGYNQTPATTTGYSGIPSTIIVTVYNDGNPVASCTHTVAPDIRPEITWRPALICATGLVQVGVSGTGPVEIESISCRLDLRERVHG